jgi:hypothetical protein
MPTYWSEGRLGEGVRVRGPGARQQRVLGQLCAPALRLDPSCGCGPEGRYCVPSQGLPRARCPTRAEGRVRDALNEEPLRIVRSVIGRDEDYYAAYTTRRSFITGALAFFYREQVDRVSGLAMTPPTPTDQMPSMTYEDAAWREYVRGPEHAGVLTTPAFLGRFPTLRARINAFRTALLCRPFEPPAGGLPAPDDACNREPNLAHRCGCQHCHSAIEPLGAYWARWARARLGLPRAPRSTPRLTPTARTCAITGQFCTPRCRSQLRDEHPRRRRVALRRHPLRRLYRSQDDAARHRAGPRAPSWRPRWPPARCSPARSTPRGDASSAAAMSAQESRAVLPGPRAALRGVGSQLPRAHPRDRQRRPPIGGSTDAPCRPRGPRPHVSRPPRGPRGVV